MREQNRQLTSALAAHQERVTLTTEELFTVKDKLARVDVSYQSLRSSYSLLEAAEKQARAQYENILKEQRGHGELLANLHSIQNNLEKSEFETKTRLGAQLQAAERELSLSKDALHAEEDRRNKMVDAYDTQVSWKFYILHCACLQYIFYGVRKGLYCIAGNETLIIRRHRDI